MIINTNQIELGNIVRDTFSGFVGTVTGVSSFATGCSQMLVQPRAKEEKDIDGILIPVKHEEPKWFDCDRLVIIGSDSEVLKVVKKTAAPSDAATHKQRGGDTLPPPR